MRGTRPHGTILAGIAAAAMLLVAGAAAGADPPADQAALEKQLADARARLDAAAREVSKLSGELYGDREDDIARTLHGGPQGSMLGVNIGGPGERDDGVEIAGVSPGGPAESAGLRAGDVIVAVNGEVLKRSDARSPASQLIAYMRKVEPGQTVKVQYLRDGKRSTVEVKSTAAEPMMMAMMRDHEMPMGMPEGMQFLRLHGMPQHGPGFGSLELVPMTPGLSRYFGTEKGLLVVRAPREPGLGLADGDVLLGIGGRTPENPGQAFRILQSYEPGDKVKVALLRDRKRMEVEATMPAASDAHSGATPPPPRALGYPRPPPPALSGPSKDKASAD